jgi:uncharacterized protein (DUF1330 family)
VAQATIIVEAVFRAGYEPYFEEYSQQVRRYLDKHGGQVIRRQKIDQVLYGQERPDLVMIIDFPTRELAERIFFEQEYLDIIPLRERVFSRFSMYLAAFGSV